MPGMWTALVTAVIASAAGLAGVLIGQRGERRKWRRDAKFQAHTDLLAMVHRYLTGDVPTDAEMNLVLARDELVTDDVKIPYGVMDMLLRSDQGVDIAEMTTHLVARCRQDLGLKYVFQRQPGLPGSRGD
jgi:hypothetical protein